MNKKIVPPSRFKKAFNQVFSSPYVRIFGNQYVLAITLFTLWIGFFDSYSLVNQQKLKNRLQEIRDQKTYYEAEILRLEADMKELNSDPTALEKFAREKYKFKKKGEEVFIIEEE